ncbi:MAG: CHRD domain-containing protein [Rhodocyclales bacterium]|nr:CHRD domain-containing protein [Rhodocyclales bacterium]
MKPSHPIRLFAATVVAVAGLGISTASADVGAEDIKARLDSYQEDPLALSTPANGSFRAMVDRVAQTIAYELSYAGVESGVLQAHIHFGRHWQSGGVAVFLCANGVLKPKPTVPDCPVNAGTVSGVVGADDVIGPISQGIAPGEFAELADAIANRAAYVNVHTHAFPRGEIRGQIR